jgi:uncharacterized protein
MMRNSQIIEEISKIVEAACKSDSNIFGYGIWTHHILCVVKYAKQLAEQLNADSEIVEIAAFLHDYAGIKDRSLIAEHHIYGAAEAEIILRGFSYPEDKISLVKDCILSHRGSIKAERLTPEAECIASADAMAHVFQVSSLLHLAYVKHGMSIEEGRVWVLKKIERSMDKLKPEVREMMQEHYSKVKDVLI